MNQIFSNLPDVIYATYLQTIGNIKFTRREVDVIACLLSAKTVKAIAQLLSTKEKSISVKSIDTHILNIKRKISGNYKNQIIAFVEKAQEYHLIHSYYLALLVQQEFYIALNQLQDHLDEEMPMVKVIAISKDNKLLAKLLNSHLQKFCAFSYIEATEENCDTEDFLNQYNNSGVIVITDKTMAADSSPQDTGNSFLININNYDNYYSLFFAILKSIFNKNARIIEELNVYFNTKIYNAKFNIHTEYTTTPNTGLFKQKFTKIAISIFFVLALLVLLVVSILYISPSTPKIRSDLILPKQATLLERPEMISKINNIYSSYASSNRITGPCLGLCLSDPIIII